MEYLANGHILVRIVITGGPCSGKSSALERCFDELSREGYYILRMPETATQLISNGINPTVCSSMFEYQSLQIPLQFAKEKVYARASREISSVTDQSILIIYDRGLMDNKAYMTDEEFLSVIESLGLTEEYCLNLYDAVFHLTTAAKGAREFYSCDNNKARMETADEAVLVDDHSLYAWQDHPSRTIIDNSTGFEEKMNRLFDGIREVLSSIPKSKD